MVKFCPNCGLQLNEDTASCPSCGAIFATEVKKVKETKTEINKENDKSSNNYAIWGFTLSIIGAVSCCWLLCIPGIVLSIMSLCTKKNNNSFMLELAGIVLPFVIPLIYYLLYIVFVFLVSFFSIAMY